MKIRLLILFLISALTASAAGCAASEDTEASLDIAPPSEAASQSVALPSSEDMGQEYINSLIFIGESTTYHLKSREVLRGGRETDQVWATESGTLNLDMTTKNAKIVYPRTGELLTFREASKIAKPKYVVLTFGLNGAVQKIKLGADYHKECYLALIEEIMSESPNTRIILQSAFPVASNMNMSNYSVDAKTLNEYIDTINRWTSELAADKGFAYLDTAQALKNDQGFLCEQWQVGDGHHLTADAYRLILQYIRTHGYK